MSSFVLAALGLFSFFGADMVLIGFMRGYCVAFHRLERALQSARETWDRAFGRISTRKL